MGYTGVNSSGTLTCTRRDGDGLGEHLAPLAGRRRPAHREGSTAYLAWHYADIFKQV